ncbi:MAG: glycosyltransferase family 2 protein [Lacibacter sp.]
MIISGVIIVRNAVKNDYPVVEAITSVLPVVDEMIVSLDPGEDDTEQLIRSISSDKIRMHYTRWDMSLRKGGAVYALETDKALRLVRPDADWIFYIQADEVIHEQYHAVIRETAARYLADKRVEGLLFTYKHFYGTYDYVGSSRKWYKHEVRIIRNNPAIRSYKDAQGFRKNGKKIKVVPVAAEVYHYGWVKSPEQMKRKQKNVLQFYTDDDAAVAAFRQEPDFFDYTRFDLLEKFTGTHPAVMQQRIAARNWQVELDVSRRNLNLKEWFLFQIEKITGKRLFSFRNYTRIRL